MSLQSILAVFTSIVCGALGAYIFAPALRASSSSRRISSVSTTVNREEKRIIQSIEYREEKDIVIPPCTLPSSSSSVTIASTENILLSLIIPAYNEEKRLPGMLQETMQYLAETRTDIIQLCHKAISLQSTACVGIEIIIVNDGSTDQTVVCTKQYIHEKMMTLSGPFHIRFITLTHNRGKGAAVQVGMLQSHGKLCLMLDADGATDFASGIHSVLDKMISMSTASHHPPDRRGFLSVYGSRAHLQKQESQQEKNVQRSLIRIILMHGFHFFVRTLCSSHIQDTQCGFKLFTQPAAQVLFQNLHLHRWAFDIELVVMSELLGFPVEEVSVQWQEIEGSKLATSKIALIRASVDMLRDMICVRLCYSLGIWKIQK